MQELKINHLAVVASVVFMFVLGFLWYGPLFGEAWMGMVGLSMETVEANPPGAGIWITNIVSSVVGVYALAWIMVRMNVSSLAGGAVAGLLIGLAFNLLPAMVNNMFAQVTYGLAWITGGFQTVGWTGCGIILGSWTKSA